MKRAIILTGGELPSGPVIRRAADASHIIIAADSGFDAAVRYGLHPDYVVGDMDSVQNKEQLKMLRQEQVFRYPHEKDDTDTEIALKLAREKGSGHITLIGGGGGRLDHLIGILRLFDRDTGPDEWYTRHERIIAIPDSLEARGMEGRRVSFFPVGPDACTMISDGLKWPLDRLVWARGDVGISNEITGAVMKVTMKTGRLIMVCGIDLEVG